MSDTDQVLFEMRGGIGLITLNRPKALNSLTRDMCNAVTSQLEAWQDDPRVRAVVVTGAGEKAFCAGGDVVMVANSIKDGTQDGHDFFHDEYLMNIAIKEYPKPYISLVDGIVMGGGVGISVHGDFWVASDKTLFAMPETGIGLFPDVGGGWFLPRLPGEIGMYLALTGARIKAADLYAVGIASHFVTSDKTEALIDALAAADIHCEDCVKTVLDKFHNDPGSAPLALHMEQIDEHFSGFSVEDILMGLETDSDEWCQKQYATIMRMSPMSLKVTFEQLRRGGVLDSFRENMKMELRIGAEIAKGNDFVEGIRALLIDKDNSPKWNPATLTDISERDIADHFENIGSKELRIG